MYRDHRKGPGGPPGGATYPGGPRGLKVEGNQPLVGWGAPLGPPAMRLGLGTLGGELPPCLGGQGTPSPLWPPPPLGDPISLGRRPPGGLYKGGEGGQQPTALGASLLPCNTSLSRAEARRSPAGEPLHPSPRRRAVGSASTSPPPLLDQERRRRRCTVRVLNAEVPYVRHSVIGDLDHGEYDSVIHVHWNASARDLQGYADALLSPRC